jgi:rSAM/selenodomain-associated transferase 2/rSAM/selenodomain-associated transferase 1
MMACHETDPQVGEGCVVSVALDRAPGVAAERALHETPRPAAVRLIVFARYPEAGKVKTRLIPALGPDGAAALHKCLVQAALATARQFRDRAGVDIEVRSTGAAPAAMRELFGDDGDDIAYRSQQGSDLGNRLGEAVATAFAEAAQSVIVIGSDCPSLDLAVLEQALEALKRSDVVLGPAVDGGYYLLGLRSNATMLFDGVAWGTEKVLSQTIDRANKQRLKVSQLATLSDVDYVEDLVACRQCHGGFEPALPSVRKGVLSVILPTLNEVARLSETLRLLRGRDGVEVIVADGGSTDGTVELAGELGATVVTARPGRGRQMNAGAALASGEALLFLHADTKLPGSFRDQVWSLLARGTAIGAFRLRIDGNQFGLRCVEWGANMRARCFGMPYGDQALFMTARLFFELGGYENWPLMEDYDLCRRARQRGPVQIAAEAVVTSDRRWRERGVLRTTLINRLCVAGFRLGVSPSRLATWYDAPSTGIQRCRFGVILGSCGRRESRDSSPK